MFDIFELFINVYQSVIVTYFLVKCLGIKDKDMKPFHVYIAGSTITLIYLEVLSKVTIFESVGVFLYLAISITFSFMLLAGKKVETIFYNLLLLAVLAFSSLLAMGTVGLFFEKDFLNTIMPETISRIYGVLLDQVILSITIIGIIKLKKNIALSDSKYAKVFCAVPVISIIVCCLIIYRNEQDYTMQLIYTVMSVVGVIVVNVVNLFLLSMEHRIYTQRMREKVLLDAYKQKEKDIEAIKVAKIENDKLRHEVKKILMLTSELIADKKYEDASEFMNKFIETRSVENDNLIYSNNVILNYLLNRKVNQCKELNIDITCFVNGEIERIEDVDLYILLENLIDNGIEACAQIQNSKMSIAIYSEPECIEIEVGNSVKENVIVTNPHMQTTKKEKELHGYGLQNVQDVVEKYQGEIKYTMNANSYLKCKVKIKK